MAVNHHTESILLIVESGTIASAIQSINYPGLTCLPTKGYLWYPFFKKETESLQLKANPTLLSERKVIKESAQIVSKVIIATDNDPSGDFIAYSLSKKLPQIQHLYRGSLTNISYSGINSVIENASLIQTENLKLSLIKYFWVRSYLVDFLMSRLPNFTFQESVFIISLNEWIKSKNLIEFNCLPLSTASVLSKMKMESYSKCYQTLNNLFAYIHTNGQNVISYPRTSNHGYTVQTWNYLCSDQFSIDTSFIPIPTYSRIEVEPGSHESIYAVNLCIEPNHIRPFVTLNEFKMYKFIYESTILSLDARNFDQNTSTFDFQLMELMVSTGFVKPSGLAALMDNLVQKKWLKFENEISDSTSFFHNLNQTYRIPKYHILSNIFQLISDNTVDLSRIKSTIQSIKL